MERIVRFEYEHYFLANFFTATVVMDGAAYASVEHAYQAAKAADPKDRWIFMLENNPRLTAAQAKKVGKKIKLRDDWDRARVVIMRDLVGQKFNRNELTKKLLATGDAYLEEGNWWHDTFWGVCYHKIGDRVCREPEHKPCGGNHLGHLLMDIRDYYAGLPPETLAA